MMKTYPCVGFELHYSPFERDCIENLAHQFISLTTHLGFDVRQPIAIHQKLVILFSNKLGPTEKLYGEIISCALIDNDTYRIRVALQNKCSSSCEDIADSISMPVCKGIATTSEITVQCPACKTTTEFNLIANQNGEWDKGIMPLYNCTSCGTTRAMIGLLEFNIATP